MPVETPEKVDEQALAEAAIQEKGLPVDELYPSPSGGRHVPNFDVYQRMYRESLDEPEKFWGEHARQLRWVSPYHTLKVENFDHGDIRWFIGGRLNVADNCIDRWAEKSPDRVAIIHEGDDPEDVRKVTYAELLRGTCSIANLLKLYGVRKGDRVTIYMPMIPELAMTMLACARIGAVHSVVFAGFSAQALEDRLHDAQSAVVITADFGVRSGKSIHLKNIVDDALQNCPFVHTCLVFLRDQDRPIQLIEGRDVWADEALQNMPPYCPCEPMDSEDPLFMLYTSGSTGKPKGIVHTTAGYLLFTAMTHKYTFDYEQGDVFACVADCGWITGHSYIVYGALCNGATTFMFESVPTFPDCSRYWDMVERHKITQFYTAPTALRAIMRFGDDAVKKHDRSSLRVLGCVGEPINPEVWRWYYEVIGEKRCPIVDTFWQTETGGFMITPLPFAFSLKPGSATLPFFGVEPAVMDPITGEEKKGNNVAGVLCFKRSWPSTLRTIWRDHERMLDVYFRPFPGYYLTGDGCVRDKDGYYWITGRVDDVLNVSGHRIGSAEVEHALVQHESVAEAAVVGCHHDIKGEGIFCFVTLKVGIEGSDSLIQSLKQKVRSEIGPVATPDVIVFTAALPKTRSGKIMRRILRKVSAKDTESLGDVSTLADPSVVEDLIKACANI
eukprot:GEMP01018132.1.p1 GENE.GEMP01018132.1~~GEMP01018132.1.p1  ORF type:complete len:669 (+),score=148.23 GEMP01018132.1:51-2057(+)